MIDKLYIITVVKNDPVNLGATIDSVADACAKNPKVDFYHVIWDGGSDRDTEILVDEKCRFSSNMIYHREPDLGIYDAMNKATRFVANDQDFIIWINAGDRLLFNEFNKINVGEQVEAIFGAVVDNRGHIHKPLLYNELSEYSVFPKTKFRHQAFLIRKSLFEKLGKYNLDVGLQADGLLMSQTQIRKTYACCDELISFFDLGGVSNTRHFEALISYFKVCSRLNLNFFKLFLFQRIFILKLLVKAIIRYKPI